MKEFSFDFECDGLCGTVYLPSADSELLPTVIFCHGFGGSRKLFRYYEQLKGRLRKSGCAVVTFDFFGCGESVGSYECMTYGIWADNIRSVFEWAGKQRFCDRKRIGIAGFSSGTAAAFRYAVDGGEASFVISVASCAGTDIGMQEGGPYGRTGGTFMGKQVGACFFSDLLANAPAEKLGGVDIPVLLLQGTADNPWRIRDSERWAELLPNAKLILYEGAPHNLSTHARAAARDTVAWLKEIYFIQ